MFTVSSKSHPQGSGRQLRRVVGMVSALALVLTLSGGVNARQLRLDSPEMRAVYTPNDNMLLLLKLKTDAGRQVLVYG